MRGRGLVEEAEVPKGDDISVGIFEVVLDDVCIGDILHLAAAFALSAYLEG